MCLCWKIYIVHNQFCIRLYIMQIVLKLRKNGVHLRPNMTLTPNTS